MEEEDRKKDRVGLWFRIKQGNFRLCHGKSNASEREDEPRRRRDGERGLLSLISLSSIPSLSVFVVFFEPYFAATSG